MPSYRIYNNGEGSIGADGGKISVGDPNSVLNGVSVAIPKGALQSEVTISIQLDNTVLPGGDNSVNVIKFTPDGLNFKVPIEFLFLYTTFQIQNYFTLYLIQMQLSKSILLNLILLKVM